MKQKFINEYHKKNKELKETKEKIRSILEKYDGCDYDYFDGNKIKAALKEMYHKLKVDGGHYSELMMYFDEEIETKYKVKYDDIDDIIKLFEKRSSLKSRIGILKGMAVREVFYYNN